MLTVIRLVFCLYLVSRVYQVSILSHQFCVIDHGQIIERLSTDGRFKSICKRIAKKKHLAEDLYQEFFLALCEIKDDRLIEAYEGNYLEVLCVGIINNIWGKRERVKSYENGKTSPLYELTSRITSLSHDMWQGEDYTDTPFARWIQGVIVDKSEPYDQSKDKFLQEVKDLVNKSMNSEDENERFVSRVFHYSSFKFKNVKAFSKESKIPYGVCRRAYKEFKNKVEELRWVV